MTTPIIEFPTHLQSLCQRLFFPVIIGCEYPENVGDGICDDPFLTNNAECNFDGNDCCKSSPIMVYCDECICYPSQTCDGPLELIGNGFCDDETNTADCDFDGGDCCLNCPNKEHCTICSCHEGGEPYFDLSCKYSLANHILTKVTFQIIFFLQGCDYWSSARLEIGNGLCQDSLNNPNCYFDNGDCCGTDVTPLFCLECVCYEDCVTSSYPHWIDDGTEFGITNYGSIGDGYCDDESNIEGCLFDRGDCCGPNINLDFCTECICYDDLPCYVPSELIGDGSCNDEANIAKCSFDDGDCLCESVLSQYIGDGNCQDENNNPECQFDGGDCCGSNVITLYCIECVCLCTAPLQKIGNGICNDEANNLACSFDGGDCCGSNVNTDYCTECTCFECFVPNDWIANGICNEDANKAQCNFDGGDCCEATFLTATFLTEFIGNGECQDALNTAQCLFDGGDCCGLNVNTTNCIECFCYEDCYGHVELVRNGMCNDETNTPACNFDGGDCCGSSINCVDTSLCSECLCHPKSPINMNCKK